MKHRTVRDQNRSKGKRRFLLFIGLAEVLSVSSLFSLGLSAWVAEGEKTGTLTAGVGAADVVGGSPEHLDVITISALNGYSYAPGYGFSNDGLFSNRTTFSGTCIFNASYGKRCFNSFNTDGSFGLDIVLTTSLSGGFASRGFSSDDITLSSDNFATASGTPTSDTTIAGSFDISCTSNAANFTFTFSIAVVYGNSLTSFPDLTGATFNVTFTPKESE